jgi:hypothetical protein
VTSTIQAGYLLRYVPLAHEIILAALGPNTPEEAPKKPPAAPPENSAESP